MKNKSLSNRMEIMRTAQKEYSTFSQEKVDKIFFEAARAANLERISLAKLAVEETKMGILEDKVIKNHYASEFIYNKYRDTKTCGVFEEDNFKGHQKIYEPVGILAAVIPTTNPTSTTIFKALIALKTRNAVFFAPHPRAIKCTKAAADVINKAAIKAGAPNGLIDVIEEPSIEGTRELMSSSDLILATGGPGMVASAYSSGTPAIGVGAGNTPAILHKTCDITMAVNSVIMSKTFDYGVICASEQSIIVDESIYDEVKELFISRGCYYLNEEEKEAMRKVILVNGKLNAKIVGQKAKDIASLAGIDVPEHTKILMGEVEDSTTNEAFSHEKLSVILGVFKSKNHKQAVEIANILINHSGLGHTSAIYANEDIAKDDIDALKDSVNTTTVLVNQPSSQGAIGDMFNFQLAPSLTLGCGSWGNNSVSENVGPLHLLNIKTITFRRENMQWFKIPKNIYYKLGCLEVALEDLKLNDKKKAFIVSDSVIHSLGWTKKVEEFLNKAGISHMTFTGVNPDPTIENVEEGVKIMKTFKPDTIIAIGGGSPMDAAKIMWALYEHEDISFNDISMTFLDIRKRICRFPKMGKKASLVCIPTSAGTGSEVTPFAVITDEKTNIKYPIADYELTPETAIVDPALMLSMPASLAAASGLDVLAHALESLVSTVATDYTLPYSKKAIQLVFENLRKSVEGGAKAKIEKENMANASCLAGMAFSNAFLGICHSMAHKIGGEFHIPHGVANSILLPYVIEYNANEEYATQSVFSQYTHPQAKERYAEISVMLGFSKQEDEDSKKVKELIKGVKQLIKDVGVKPTISEYGISEEVFMEKIDDIAMNAFDDQCTGANPIYPKISDLKEILVKAYK